MLNNKLKTMLMKIVMIFPIIPISLTIHYLNKYSGINEMLRLYLSIFLVGITLALTFLGLYFFQKKHTIGTRVMLVVMILLSGGSSYFTYINARIYGSLNQMTTDQSTAIYNLVTMSDSEVRDVREFNGDRIGILHLSNPDTATVIESYLIETGLSSNNEVLVFDSPIELVHGLYSGELDGIIIGSNFKSLFLEQEGFETIETDTVILDSIEIIVERTVNERLTPLTEEPFSVLLIGVDSLDGLGAGLADSIILATFNPQNLSVTMTSIPRDTYVEVPYFNYSRDKITHAHNGGAEAVVGAVENLFGIEIPYYVRVNFSAIVELVDAIGGIEVDVPMDIEEQNSRRQFGKHMITIEKGLQVLDGEQALAFSRHRKTLATGDLGRANHQQMVIEGIINQILSEMNSVNEFLSILNILGHNVETNLTVNEMTSLVQFLLELAPTFTQGNPLDYIHMKSMVLSGEPGRVNTIFYSFPLSVIFPFEGAIRDARDLISINLEIQEPQFTFDFAFNGFGNNTTIWIPAIYNESPSANRPEPNPPVQEAPIWTPPQQETPPVGNQEPETPPQVIPEIQVPTPEVTEPEVTVPETSVPEVEEVPVPENEVPESIPDSSESHESEINNQIE